MPSVASSCNLLEANDYMPLNPAGITAANYDKTYGLGSVWPSNAGGILRGSHYTAADEGGMFGMDLTRDITFRSDRIGFRCVYRP
jgi:hypothetical protein